MHTQPFLILLVGASLSAAGCKQDPKESAAPAPSATASGSPSATPTPTPTPTPAASGGSKAMGKPVDACSLLSKADAEAATGRKLSDPIGKPDVWAKCKFTLTTDPPAPIVELTVISLADAATAKQALEELRKDNVESEPASGIGETAFWDQANVLNVLKGTYVVKVNISSERMGSDSEPERTAAKPIAEKVLAKLP